MPFSELIKRKTCFSVKSEKSASKTIYNGPKMIMRRSQKRKKENLIKQLLQEALKLNNTSPKNSSKKSIKEEEEEEMRVLIVLICLPASRFCCSHSQPKQLSISASTQALS